MTPQHKLLPCPFCNGEAILITRGNDATKKRSAEVECSKCHTKQITGAIRNNIEWCEQQAIKQWNNRILSNPTDVRSDNISYSDARTKLMEFRQNKSDLGITSVDTAILAMVEFAKDKTAPITQELAEARREIERLKNQLDEISKFQTIDNYKPFTASAKARNDQRMKDIEDMSKK